MPVDPQQPLRESSTAFDTLAVRAGQQRGFEQEHNEPIYTTSSFVFKNAAEAAARFADEEPGNVYSRFTNPTVRLFEQRLAALEGVRFALATASGMGAILTLALATLKAGDHVVASQDMFGSSVSLFAKVLSRLGVQVTFVPVAEQQAWRAAIVDNTRLLFVETPSNPLCELADLNALSAIAKQNNCLFAVDNCFCTPALQRPREFGADVIVHSATKYLDGQGRCVGGCLVTDDEQLYKQLFGVLRTTGISMSPFNAWVFGKGLETLSLRMDAHCRSAAKVAQWLSCQPPVARVFYPGLSTHPQHALAKRQQRGFGGIVSFTLNAQRDTAWALIDRLAHFSITANLGDAKSTVTHPASTTHARLSKLERQRMGIDDSLIRLSIGLEDPVDLINDLDHAMNTMT